MLTSTHCAQVSLRKTLNQTVSNECITQKKCFGALFLQFASQTFKQELYSEATEEILVTSDQCDWTKWGILVQVEDTLSSALKRSYLNQNQFHAFLLANIHHAEVSWSKQMNPH